MRTDGRSSPRPCYSHTIVLLSYPQSATVVIRPWLPVFFFPIFVLCHTSNPGPPLPLLHMPHRILVV